MPKSELRTASEAKICRFATYIYVGGYFISALHGTGNSIIKIRYAYIELPLLVLIIWIGIKGEWQHRGLARAFAVNLVVTILFVGGMLVQSKPLLGSSEAYLKLGLAEYFYIVITVVFAFTLFDAKTFLDVWLKTSTVAVLLAIAGYIVANITTLFVTFASYGGGLRLTGMLNEPSAWAPVIAASIVIAWKKSSYWLVALFFLAGLLTKSPTVILVLAVVLISTVLTTKGYRYARVSVLAGLAALTPYAILAITKASFAQNLILSGNPIEVSIGRLFSGLHFIQTGGQSGSNDRAQGAQNVLAEIGSQGGFWLGHGLGASQVYFPAATGQVEAYSLPLTIVFDVGVLGLSAYIVFVLRSLWRLRRTEVFWIFFPFVLATSINSAEGLEFFKFSLLAIFIASHHAHVRSEKNRQLVTQ